MNTTTVLFILSLSCVACDQLTIAVNRTEIEPNYEFTNVTVDMKVDQKAHKYGIDIDVDLRKSVDDFIYDLSISFALQGISYSFGIYNRTRSLCRDFKTKDTSFMKRYDGILKYGNFPDRCPIKAGYYFLHNFTLFQGILPKHYPRGAFAIEISIRAKNGKKVSKFAIIAFYGKVIKV